MLRILIAYMDAHKVEFTMFMGLITALFTVQGAILFMCGVMVGMTAHATYVRLWIKKEK